jgi:hypothetical protein
LRRLIGENGKQARRLAAESLPLRLGALEVRLLPVQGFLDAAGLFGSRRVGAGATIDGGKLRLKAPANRVRGTPRRRASPLIGALCRGSGRHGERKKRSARKPPCEGSCHFRSRQSNPKAFLKEHEVASFDLSAARGKASLRRSRLTPTSPPKPEWRRCLL